jgi:alpha-tubulin suppressor-like RCC1 family protein
MDKLVLNLTHAHAVQREGESLLTHQQLANKIVQVAAGAWHTVGLEKDGTVVATGKNADGQCNVSG